MIFPLTILTQRKRSICCHRGIFHSQEVIDCMNEKMKATWSPEQIVCTPCELRMPDLREILGEWEPESTAAQREKPRN